MRFMEKINETKERNWLIDIVIKMLRLWLKK